MALLSSRDAGVVTAIRYGTGRVTVSVTGTARGAGLHHYKTRFAGPRDDGLRASHGSLQNLSPLPRIFLGEFAVPQVASPDTQDWLIKPSRSLRRELTNARAWRYRSND